MILSVSCDSYKGGPYLDDNIKKTQSPMLFGKSVE